ncbi:hypothetical protein MHO82_06545 [Vibrio sp. Of7-15]|uniref:hypothetical protein n=1 Tax=Vibrio sp. Of7-15 TaxID=2724879 RepID=UPI001EF1EE3E|nr:hypothetical protein [Vibrio sp. Of7-15]MCG7496514.1 hypothetical protein [Vibrio sp. Of7-15]
MAKWKQWLDYDDNEEEFNLREKHRAKPNVESENGKGRHKRKQREAKRNYDFS